MGNIRPNILASIILNIIFMMIIFSTDNPLIIVSIGIFTIIMLWLYNGEADIKRGFKMFIPLAIIVSLINLIFVNGGVIVLFQFMSRTFTLETLLYALTSSIKLIIIIYVFYLLSHMVDSDKTLSCFSKKMPKVTLIMLIGLKLVPNMKKRIKAIREVYEIRGVDYSNKNIKSKIKSYLPVLSILLEDSLEGSFDISESAYVRGFLSGKRSEYDRENLKLSDKAIILISLIIFFIHIYFTIKNYTVYDVYSANNILDFINKYSLLESEFILFTTLGILIFILFKGKGMEHELH